MALLFIRRNKNDEWQQRYWHLTTTLTTTLTLDTWQPHWHFVWQVTATLTLDTWWKNYTDTWYLTTMLTPRLTSDNHIDTWPMTTTTCTDTGQQHWQPHWQLHWHLISANTDTWQPYPDIHNDTWHSQLTPDNHLSHRRFDRETWTRCNQHQVGLSSAILLSYNGVALVRRRIIRQIGCTATLKSRYIAVVGSD